jgi:hypothetical protein
MTISSRFASKTSSFAGKTSGLAGKSSGFASQSPNLARKKQGGVILLVTLFALVILMMTSIALVRSTDTNLILAGNYAFKRDVLNQAERAVPTIKALFTSSTGPFFQTSSRFIDVREQNYFATIQASNTQGIPNALFDVALNNANNINNVQSGVVVRYVIDRMSLAPGAPNIANGGFVPINQTDSSGDAIILGTGTTENTGGPQLNGGMVSVYRISLRATGPRNTETLLQVVFSI